ncbi:MAG: hypothetical protein R6U38_11555 [Desulfatiglandaceae bacterium]
MSQKLRRCTPHFFSALALICFAAMMSGCAKKKLSSETEAASTAPIDQVVVMGFKAAVSEGDMPKVFRNPVTGSALTSYPVPHFAVEGLTDELFDLVLSRKKWELVPPGQARGVVENILSSDSQVGMRPVKILQKVGNTFGADAVLTGYIYRWREREGRDFAAERPASVAFDLYLVNPADGSVIWRRNFNKTQQSLFENLLDFSTYIKSGGRWLTAGELAMLGLKQILNQLPGPSKAPE